MFFDKLLLGTRYSVVVRLTLSRALASLLDLIALFLLSFLLASIPSGKYAQPLGVDIWLTGQDVSEDSFLLIGSFIVLMLTGKSLLVFTASFKLRDEAATIQETHALTILQTRLNGSVTEGEEGADLPTLHTQITHSLGNWVRMETVAKPIVISEIVNILALSALLGLNDPLLFLSLATYLGAVLLALKFIVTPNIARGAKENHAEYKTLMRQAAVHQDLTDEINSSGLQSVWSSFAASQVGKVARTQASVFLWSSFPRIFFEVAAVLGISLLVAVYISTGSFQDNLAGIALGIVGIFRITGSVIPLQAALNMLSESKPKSLEARSVIAGLGRKMKSRPQISAELESIVSTLVASTAPGVHVLQGFSGAGKTSILREILSRSNQGAAVSYLPQKPVLIPWSFWANVTMEPDEACHDSSRVPQLDAVLWEILRCDEIQLSWVRQIASGSARPVLSAGEIQRLGIARAFHRNVDLVILDEPSSALDTAMKLGLAKFLSERHDGKIIVSSHDSEFVSGLAKPAMLLRIGS